MADPIVSAGEEKLRAPRTIREALSLAVAFGLCFGTSFAVAPLVSGLAFVPEDLRGYLNGLPLGAVPALNANINRALQAAASRASGGTDRPDLPPWFVTGFVAATALFAWNWFVAFLSKSAMTYALAPELDRDAAQIQLQAINGASSIIAVVLTALAVVFAGRMLNRFTRDSVFGALVVTAIAYLGLQFALSYYFNPAEFSGLVRDSVNGGAGSVAGMVVGLMIIPVAIVAFGAIGVAYSHLARERSMGRLANAARPLSDADRNAATDQILARLQSG